MSCQIDGCSKPTTARGMCQMHYTRLRRHGDPHVVRKQYDWIDPIARFWSKVDKRDDDECWPWLGTVLSSGYGQFAFEGAKVAAHRFSYELVIGPIPDGLALDHVYARGCRRRDCVNPSHLEPVTITVNNLRSLTSLPAVNARKDRCLKGHAFDIVSIRGSSGRPRRRCRQCLNEWNRENRNPQRAVCPECQQEMLRSSLARHMRRWHKVVAA